MSNCKNLHFLIFSSYWLDNIIFAVGIIVANIPQGLLSTTSLCLTIAARRLARRNVLVKNLESVETLGSCTLICSDKTGTLTQNRMTVVDLWHDFNFVPVLYPSIDTMPKSRAEAPNYNNEDSLSTQHFLQRCAILCNRTIFDNHPENMALPVLQRKTFGDASETALLKYWDTRTNYVNATTFREQYPKLFEIPFNSKNKFQISIHKNVQQPNDPHLLMIKGAPERIIQKCSHILVDREIVPMSDEIKHQFDTAYETLAGRGERVLGFAQHVLDPQQYPPTNDTQYSINNYPENGYVFLGLMGLLDPPKVGVVEAIQKCKNAGIQVVMVTGYVKQCIFYI